MPNRDTAQEILPKEYLVHGPTVSSVSNAAQKTRFSLHSVAALGRPASTKGLV